jgi:BirA family biotin operon repressor/biotin-[acetyl-CoA-carboxylase] ligase
MIVETKIFLSKNSTFSDSPLFTRMSADPDIFILRSLFAQGNSFISGSQLASQLGLSRSAVWRRIEQLQQLGYAIEARPHVGYRLTEAPDIIVADELRARLPGNRFAERLVVFRETRSTNDIVLREALHHVPEGFTALAESQTNGRGRMGRPWESAGKKGLWLSILLRPQGATASPQGVIIMSSVAVARTLEKFAPRAPAIKWPNDLVLDRRKLCGILVEARFETNHMHHAIVGIGLNVNHQREDFPESLQLIATSLALEAGQSFRRADVLLELFQQMDRATQEDWTSLLQEWKDRCETFGRSIRVSTPTGVLEGTMTGVDPFGHLQLRLPSGRIETLASGTIL